MHFVDLYWLIMPNIDKEGIKLTLGDLTKAFNKFLTACGYQVEIEDAQEELDLRRKDKDFFI